MSDTEIKETKKELTLEDVALSEEERRDVKLRLTDWVYKQYGISFAPKYFFVRLNQIYKGTYKGLDKPIPPEDLFDMWQRKWHYLEKVRVRNESRGKHIQGLDLIWYDLAILLSKYDSYLNWKIEHLAEIAEQMKRYSSVQEKINYNKIAENTTPTSSTQKLQSSDVDIDDFLDFAYEKK